MPNPTTAKPALTPPAEKPQHTPGPWQVDGSYVYSPDGKIIATVSNPGTRWSDYPLVANRDLMAAAPEMLAELQALAEWVEEFALPAMGDDTEGGTAYLASAQAAIAKAEGR